MAAPTRVAAVTQTASGTTAATADISAAAVGSWELAVFTTDSNGVGPLPAGWTLLLPVGTQQATGTRRTAIAARIKQSGDTSVAWNSAASAYKRLTLAHGLGSAPISAWTVGMIGVRAAGDVVSGQSVQAGSSTTSVAPGVVAPADSLVITVLVEATTAVGEPTVSGASVWLNSGDASPVIEQHTIAYTTPAAGTTGAVTGTYVPTQASNGMGVQIVIPAASASPVTRTGTLDLVLSLAATATTPTPPGFANVAQMLATPGATWAHRGGSANWPEMSEYAYDQAVRAGYGALEFSAQRTNDGGGAGTWIGSHDTTPNRTSQTSGAPAYSAMSYSTLQATYQNTLNSAGTPRPYYRLVDFLDKYTPTHVVIVDPKEELGRITEFLDILDAHGGNTKIVVKFFGTGGGSTALADAAAARGYQTWGYFYQAGFEDGSLARDQDHWSILGMNYDASQAAWDAVTSYGKPVVGHIIPSQAAYNTAIAKGARMAQVANVAGVTAVGASTIPGELPLQVAFSAARTVDTARTAQAGTVVEFVATRAVDVARAGVLSLTLEASSTQTADVARGADLAVTVAPVVSASADTARAAALGVTVALGGFVEAGTIARDAVLTLVLGRSADRAVDTERQASLIVSLVLRATPVANASRAAALTLSVELDGDLTGDRPSRMVFTLTAHRPSAAKIRPRPLSPPVWPPT